MRRIVKVTGFGLAGVAGLLLALLLGLLVAANTDTGRAWIAAAAEDALSTAQAPATVSGIAGTFPQDLRLARLVLRDRDGAWLTVENARLAWRPLALLRGRLEVAVAGAERIALARLPAGAPAAPPPEEAPGPALDLPQLPLALRLDRLAVDRLELGAPVAGTAAAFEIAGQAAAPAAGAITSRLALQRLDGPPETLRAEAAFDRGAGTLRLDVDLDAPPGGLAAGLLDLPVRGPIRLDLAGDGPLDAWPGRVSADLGGLASLEAELRLTDRRRLALTGTADAPGLLDATTRRLLGGPVELDLALRRTDGLAAEIARGRLATGTLDVRLSGRLSADAGTLDATAAAELTDPAPLNALAAPGELAGISATVHATGPFAAPELRLDARAARAGVAQAGAEELALRARYTPEQGLMRGALSLEATAPRTVLTAPALKGFDGAPLELALDGRLDLAALALDQARLRAALGELSLAADGTAGLSPLAGDLRVDASLPELGRFAPLVGSELAGQATLTGQLALGGPEGLLRATVSGGLRKLALQDPALAALLGERVQLAGDLALGEDGQLTVSGLGLEAAAAQLRADLTVPAGDGALNGRLSAQVPEVSTLGPALGLDLAGAAELAATLEGPAADPAVVAELRVRETAVAGQRLGTVTLKAEADTLASGPNGRVTLEADASPLGPLDTAARFALAGERLRLSELRADAPGLSLRGPRLAVPLAGGPLEGELRITSDGLGPPLRRAAGLALDGRGEVAATLGPDGDGGQRVELAGTLSGLALPDGGPTVRRLDIDGRVEDAFAAPQARLEVALAGAAAGPATFDRLTVTAEGTPQRLDLALSGEGRSDRPVTLDAAAEVALEGAAQRVTLSRLEAALGDRRLALRQPAVLRRAGAELAVQDVALQVGDGLLRLDAAKDARRVDARVSAEAVPLSYTALVLKSPRLSGALDGTLRLEGPLGAPDGAADLTLSRLGVDGTDLPPLDLRLTGTLEDGRRAQLESRLTGLGETPFELQADLPVAVALAPATAGLRDDGRLDAALAWEGAVAPLMPLVPVTGHRLTGRADLAFEAAGTPADPQVTGRARLDTARYENLDTGTLLTDLALTVTADGRRLEVTRFQARDGGSGTLTLAGGATLDPERDVPVDLRIRADSAKLVRLDYLVADADVDMDVTGTLEDMDVAGTVTVRGAEASLPQSLPPEVAELDVVTEAELQRRRQAERAARRSGEAPAPAAKAGGRIGLDIRVALPGQVFVRGAGLDSEWAGELSVTGTAAAPVVTGDLEAVRGRVSLLNKTFALEQGRVAFGGGREIDPRVDVRAVNEGDDLTAVVTVSGPASRPELALSSTPELPQDQVLSRLLFGKNPSQLGPVESAQLAAAVAQLSLGGTGPGILDRIRNAAGVDVLQIGGDAETGPTVEAGKYVTEEVFVGVEQGATAESSAVTVEVDLTDRITLESDVGVTGRSSIGIRYQWDY